MKTKTRAQMMDLSTAESYLLMASKCLTLAGEPALALSVKAALNRVDLTLASIRQNPNAIQENS